MPPSWPLMKQSISWSRALGESETPLGTLRVRFTMRLKLSDLARLARSMVISLACGSFLFCGSVILDIL